MKMYYMEVLLCKSIFIFIRKILFYLFTGTIINNTMFLMKDIIYIDNKTDPYNYWNIARYISLIIPHFSYASCIGGFIEIAWKNNRCKMCKNSDISEACGSSKYLLYNFSCFVNEMIF